MTMERYSKENVRPTYAELTKGFNILMEYWDSLPEDEREDIDKRLKEVNC